MARRRTRKEKMQAAVRIESVPENTPKQKIEPSNFYVPEISLSTKLVTADLTKTTVVTILALILQFALAKYLDNGGWQTINEVIHGILANY